MQKNYKNVKASMTRWQNRMKETTINWIRISYIFILAEFTQKITPQTTSLISLIKLSLRNTTGISLIQSLSTIL